MGSKAHTRNTLHDGFWVATELELVVMVWLTPLPGPVGYCVCEPGVGPQHRDTLPLPQCILEEQYPNP